jgi:hypothetical protein
MSDPLFQHLIHVSAQEIGEALEGKSQLTPSQWANADVNGDGKVDEQDVELMAQAEIRLADKISGAIVGMEPLSDEEKLVADRNGDGFYNLSDSFRLADDARKARQAISRLKRKP